MTDQRKATVFALAAVLLWSTVATAFKLALRHTGPVQLLAYAALVSLGVLAGIVTAQGKWGLLRRIDRKQLAPAATLGLLNPLAYYLVLFAAYDRLPAQVAQPLNFTWALTMTWLAVPLLGHKLRARDLVAGLVCYAGVLIISTGGDLRALRFDDPLGVALALGSTLLWALYWLGNARSKLDPVVGLLVNFAVGTPLVFLYALLFADLRIGGSGLWGAAYVGAVEMGFTFVLWLTALKLTASTARIANLIFLAPFLSLLFIQFVLGEPVRGATPVGLVLIVGGLWWQSRVKGRDNGSIA
jgi:drug/metabolite transporter (DMT)-like permease